MTILEKILANHSNEKNVKANDIVDIFIDARVARDFGGANVVKNLVDEGLQVEDASRTFFTFDCNPTGSDQKYAENQHKCRLFARANGIAVYDIDRGIGTHLAIEKGLAFPGSTFVSTDSHANIMGAIGSFGQGMGDQDIAAAWANGSVWFKVPESAKITLKGKRPANVTAKDIVLNLLARYGANTLLGYSVELYGEAVDKLTLDERITISSMATEMGAIIIIIPPSDEIIRYSEKATGKKIEKITADSDAVYAFDETIDIEKFVPMVSKPGKPHDSVDVSSQYGKKIDSAFIGSCTNGRMEDLRKAAAILKGRKVAPGVVLKVVPATDSIWNQALDEGLIQIFKDAGAMVSNAGCAGCAAGQVGQNGPAEITVSTGNRNFPGKQGKGEVFLTSPDIVAASAVAGFITTPDNIPAKPAEFAKPDISAKKTGNDAKKTTGPKPKIVEGKAWFIHEDNIDTDMIYHNRYLTITDISQMGQYTFDNLKGYEDFAKKAKTGDIVVTQKNFGSGSSRQQAVDCFASLGISCIVAESFGAIYERNAVNAAMPILTYKNIEALNLTEGDTIRVNFETGLIENLTKSTSVQANPFSKVQMEIYQRGGIFNK
ncbi:MAG TPA: aconitase/3-isopropylmalate dehydratase large subunit family protein [Bacteroidales bacterium]|nr:3-isopropylmalate dehydratase large subunit [Bacteroidales bacterium]HOY39000.1 aconitase/3-isopropylmalate dehydratase large subunit family protein [Bacteroidales bacterium]HQP03479.1 aconitase/3-isopropylmalate dehydratase large subunit family protein [Bacteroidales bacterium]